MIEKNTNIIKKINIKKYNFDTICKQIVEAYFFKILVKLIFIIYIKLILYISTILLFFLEFIFKNYFYYFLHLLINFV